MRAVLFLFILCCCVPVVQAAPSESAVDQALDQFEAKSPYQTYVDEGDEFFKANDFEQALVSYHKAMTLKLDDSKLYQKMGDCSAAVGRFQEALVFAQRAVEVDPANGRLYLDLVMSYAALKRFDEAKTALDETRKLLTSKEDLADILYVQEALDLKMSQGKE